MPPPVGRPTLLSATRASIVDEKKRQERVAEEKDQIGRPSASKVCGISVRRIDAKTTHYNALQKEKGDVREDQGISRGVGGRVGETGTRSVSTSRMKDNSYDPDKYRDISDLSSGATGTSSGLSSGATRTNSGLSSVTAGTSSGLYPLKHKGGSVKGGKDVTGTSSSGQSSGATGSSSKGFPSHRIQNPTASVPDPYGYTRISASQARLYRDNLDFYQNKIYSKPTSGHKIEEMLTWKGNYSMLERNHRYIQWLFPIPEGNGLNLYAQQLYEHEAQAIRDDNAAHKRVLKAYKMMLDFYGMQLADSVQGTVKRAKKDWEEQYCHLNKSRHNFLRITRILKSIGELGFERLQAPWVDFLIEEAVVKKVLPNLNGPCLMHWIMAVKDDGEREMLYRKANGLPINQGTATYDMNSESDDSDEEGEEVRTNGLDLNGTEMSRLTLEHSDNQETAKDAGLFKHVDTATAMYKQTKEAESVNVDSMSKRKDEVPIEKHVKYKAEANPAKTKSASGAESASVPVSKQKLEIPNEKPVKDTRDKTSTAGIKTTATGEEASRKKSLTGASNQPSDNLRFYQNNLHSRPSPGYIIETMLRSKGHHDFFDAYPGFIHWLFPIPESTGRNAEAQPLFDHEAEAIRNDDVLSSRVLEAFRVMLDFYGMQLCDDVKGKFKRIEKTYKERYDYLQRYRENYLRITRILISIGELGLERFQVPWIDFLISEGIDNALFPTVDGQCIQHWISAIKDEGEQHAMFRKYQKLARHRAIIVEREEETEEYMDVSNDVYIVHNNGHDAPHNVDSSYAREEVGWGYDSLTFV